MLDTLSDLQMTVITQIDSLPEAKCEVPHRESTCTVEVRWSAPARPCGCQPRHLSCQGSHDHVFDPLWTKLWCVQCGQKFKAWKWREGWYPV